MSSTMIKTLSNHSLNEEPIAVLPKAASDHSISKQNDLPAVGVTRIATRTERASSMVGAPLSSNDSAKAQALVEKRKYRLAVGSIIWCFITLGLNDGSLGPLLPVIQDYYHVNFLTVSVLFITGCSGAVTAAVLNVFISRKLAFSKILVLGAALRSISYIIVSPTPPFPAICVAFFINGMGASLLNAQGNSLLSMLYNPTAMGIAHACYGVGALISPLISTQFAHVYTNNPGSGKWALHYAVLLAFALSDMINFLVLFRGKGYETILRDMGVPNVERERAVELTETRVAEGSRSGDEGGADETASRVNGEDDSFSTVLRQAHVHILAAFVFIYVGLEVTIGGWIVTFMINERGGGSSSGYISSGFFAGLALGRVTLLWVNKKLGERNAIFLYIAIGIALEMTIWFVPSLIGNAVAVSFVGVVIGPFYPIVMSQAGRIIPRKVLSGSIGWIAGFGQSGSAVLPFATGALANRFGIISLQPLIVAMMAAMAVLWFAVPTAVKKRD